MAARIRSLLSTGVISCCMVFDSNFRESVKKQNVDVGSRRHEQFDLLNSFKKMISAQLSYGVKIS